MSTQKEWAQQYLRECMADEAQLATLLTKWRGCRFVVPASGLTRTTALQPGARLGRPLTSPGMSRLTFSGAAPELPLFWRRDWEAAGDLSVELGLSISHDQDDGTVSAGNGSRRRVTERYEDHPSKAAATWAAIVRSAIQEIEARAAQ